MFTILCWIAAWLLMASRDPSERKSIATEAALTRWANEDPTANAQRGQAGLRARFERETRDKYPDLPDAEISRRADCAYRAHMIRIRRKRTVSTGEAAA